MKPTKEQIDEFLTRGVQEVIDRDKLASMLMSGKPISMYLGIDPTGLELHIGHAINLRKMKQLQDWGHKVILLVGDFTAMIGDPSGRDELRPALTSEQVLDNARDYQKQASLILDFEGENPIELAYNSTWLAKLSFGEVVDIAANFTVQQMMERDMFVNRVNEEKPIYLHEFLYPLMQGYDSVHMGVDLEIGGSDQLFNILAGRTLMQKMKGQEKHVLTVQILEGSDGRKMSKSYNNHIPITAEPADMYGRVMSIKDDLITQYFWLATDVAKEEIDRIETAMKAGDNPRDFKMQLAREIVALYHSKEDAQTAEQAFVEQFQKGKEPEDMKEVKVSKSKMSLVDLLIELGLCESKSDARRQIEQGAVHLAGEVIKDRDAEVEIKDGDVIQKGKREYRKLKV